MGKPSRVRAGMCRLPPVEMSNTTTPSIYLYPTEIQNWEGGGNSLNPKFGIYTHSNTIWKRNGQGGVENGSLVLGRDGSGSERNVTIKVKTWQNREDLITESAGQRETGSPGNWQQVEHSLTQIIGGMYVRVCPGRKGTLRQSDVKVQLKRQ